MSKTKTIFMCSDCGNEYHKWQGKCDGCGSWNTINEVKFNNMIKDNNSKKKNISSIIGSAEQKSKTLKEIEKNDEKRLVIGMSEVDKVLGGGLVQGSVCFISGEPGQGKSTLLLQIADK